MCLDRFGFQFKIGHLCLWKFNANSLEMYDFNVVEKINDLMILDCSVSYARRRTVNRNAHEIIEKK